MQRLLLFNSSHHYIRTNSRVLSSTFRDRYNQTRLGANRRGYRNGNPPHRSSRGMPPHKLRLTHGQDRGGHGKTRTWRGCQRYNWPPVGPFQLAKDGGDAQTTRAPNGQGLPHVPSSVVWCCIWCQEDHVCGYVARGGQSWSQVCLDMIITFKLIMLK